MLWHQHIAPGGGGGGGGVAGTNNPEWSRKRRSLFTVADLRQVKLGKVPPLQTVGGVCDVAGNCRLTITNRSTWKKQQSHAEGKQSNLKWWADWRLKSVCESGNRYSLASMFTSQDSVDWRVCSQARLSPFMEDASIWQILRQEEAPAEEHHHVVRF